MSFVEFTPLPTREPSLYYEPLVIDGFEHSFTTVWKPQGTEPGAVHIKYSLGKKRPPESGFEWIDRANNIHKLSEMGLRPVLKKLGIYTTLGGIENSQYASRLDLHFPGAAAFCTAAGNLALTAAKKNPRNKMVTFELFNGSLFSPWENVRAAARDTCLISTDETLGMHDILDHSAAYLALPPALRNNLHFLASKSLCQAKDAPPIEELSELIDTALNIHTLAAVLRDEPQRVQQWNSLFRFPSEGHTTYWINHTKQHIQSLAETIGLS